MSADNGVFLEKSWDGYRVKQFSSDYTSPATTFASLEDALSYIEKEHNETEYGITLIGFYRDEEQPND